jgi:hypothetical protein
MAGTTADPAVQREMLEAAKEFYLAALAAKR